MKRLGRLPLIGVVFLLLTALACSSAPAETPTSPQQPAPAPAAPAPATGQPGAPQQPAAPQQPSAPAPAAPAPTAARVEPVIGGIAPTPVRATEPRPVPQAPSGEEARFGGVLRWVPQGSVGNLDSMTSGSAIGRGVAWHYWELLMNWDADGLEYTFTLRDNLTWHDDGRPVAIEDVEASINRWRASDRAFGPVVTDLWDGFEKIDDKSFRIKLSDSTGLLLMGLGYPGGTQPNIMPKVAADTPVGELITHYVGSGPYQFVSWEPGNEIILDRYENYVSRQEPASYRAGAKKAYFDRLQMVEIPDQQTRVAAVVTSEVDFLDVISGDFYEQTLRSDKVDVHIGSPGAQPDIHFNMASDLVGANERGRLIRLAIQAAVDAEEIMKGYGDPLLWRTCPSLWFCETVWGPSGVDESKYSQDNQDRARQLLAEAGYNGEPIKLLDPADFPTIHPIPVILRQQLEEVGFNVEYIATDWATQLQLFNTVDGWHIFTNWNSSNLYHPLVSFALRDGDRPSDYPEGYATTTRLKELKAQMAESVVLDEQKSIAAEMAKVWWDDPASVPFGQFFQLRVFDNDLRDVEVRGAPVGSPIFLNVWWDDERRRDEDPR